MNAEEHLHLHLAQSVSREQRPQIKVVCAYCTTVMTDGDGPVSHGCCPQCAARILQEAEHG